MYDILDYDKEEVINLPLVDNVWEWAGHLYEFGSRDSGMVTLISLFDRSILLISKEEFKLFKRWMPNKTRCQVVDYRDPFIGLVNLETGQRFTIQRYEWPYRVIASNVGRHVLNPKNAYEMRAIMLMKTE